ncbi:nuclear transport factor 2 family protein [Gillisia hiemivivida]|uniref:Nuclear transport factor 2 family protein n=1 Tax=Gillisia hiemivivida TaxID=291190 RepID=A0A5C6ZTF5_9FLAO|nr:nuclear transport factor 2 family protein [Gillisia hiemivivida]TXD93673.1 nuclear transport factor 2 family protein [Gillisia hiemivivida]
MNSKMHKILFLLFPLILISSCTSSKKIEKTVGDKYIPDDPKLYEEIVNMDTQFFDAYNSCNLEMQKSIYAEDIEFIHDQGGLMTSKKGILDATEKNICGKVKRHLVPGSIEVYPIKDFGAIEFGKHTFKNNQESADIPSQIGKFVIFWEKKESKWFITKVVSVH